VRSVGAVPPLALATTSLIQQAGWARDPRWVSRNPSQLPIRSSDDCNSCLTAEKPVAALKAAERRVTARQTSDLTRLRHQS